MEIPGQKAYLRMVQTRLLFIANSASNGIEKYRLALFRVCVRRQLIQSKLALEWAIWRKEVWKYEGTNFID